MLFGMCFAPDGSRVLTACRDGQASLCDWQSGDLVVPPAGTALVTGAGPVDAFRAAGVQVAFRPRSDSISIHVFNEHRLMAALVVE